MQVITTITQKGQVTIPKTLRKIFGIKKYDKVIIEAADGYIKVKPTKDILDLAGNFKPKKRKSLLSARKILEKTYRRF